MTANGEIRVVVCDDVPELRRIVRDVLEDDPAVEVVDEASTGRECIRVVAEQRPDVLLLDLSMPDVDGLEALPQIAECSPTTRVIAFSGFDEERMGDLALDRGAHHYIEKGAPLDSLPRAVHAVMEDGSARRPSPRPGSPCGRGRRRSSYLTTLGGR